MREYVDGRMVDPVCSMFVVSAKALYRCASCSAQRRGLPQWLRLFVPLRPSTGEPRLAEARRQGT
jgi:hypothetical protein